MRASIFAAIYIGSYDVTLELFEISRKNGIRTVEKIGKHFEIGTTINAPSDHCHQRKGE